MSRAKRVRKARMAARQRRRFERTIVISFGFFAEMRRRSQFRLELNASDAPEGLKTILGAAVDPLGFALDKIAEKVR